MEIEIGPRVKAARKRRALSLRALAERTGFSASFLSQVELGQASPSVDSLSRIAGALGLSLAKLLADPEPDNSPVVRAGKADLRSRWSRATVRSLLPGNADDRLSAVLVTLEPGGESGRSLSILSGQQFVYCVRGAASLTLDGQLHLLGTGDSALYGLEQRAQWKNATNEIAELLFVAVQLG